MASTSRSRSRSRSERKSKRRSRSRSRSPRRRSRSRDRKAVDARRDDPDAGEGVSLLCRNLGYNTDKEVVRNAFKEFGRVVDVYLPLDYMTKQPRGFAFVEMGDRRSAAAAIDGLDGKVIDNRAVKVLFATQKRKRPDQMQTLDPRTARGAYRGPPRGPPPPGYGYGGGYGGGGGPRGRSPRRSRRDRSRSRSRSRRRRRRDRSPSRSRSRRRD
ncbi:unnamed protein product [Pelagomonas calceolata]|uniref:RRM domain-containing protein n=1 Tax=Pelagomonas calceolata TaxID=35677 RepID=A0A8J2SU63_9STRA|nr:unnamed protein product [Pelagomonas calceolata]